MDFDLTARTARLSVGEFADFTVGPRDGGDGPTGLWRAQLGSLWHREMQAQATADHPDARFEVTTAGAVFHRGWTVHLTGRIDQVLTTAGGDPWLREIKTVLRAVPRPESELRDEYPAYFAQLATYVALQRIAAPTQPVRAELVFVETGSGLSQSIVLSASDDALFSARLERVVAFLDLQHRRLERRHTLVFRPAFANLRPGQEDTRERLQAALHAGRFTAFEAPTGFGKTGVMLEAALTALRAGACDRIVYLTSKATGQLHVVDTLAAMTAPTCNPIGYKPISTETDVPTRIAVWQVRNKGEHCVNHTFHCVRDECRFLQELEARWPASGLDRFHRSETESRDIKALRTAGLNAAICPYEITRTALAFQDVWVGDYNYVFAPRNRTLFENQPDWNPARTLLIIDEAHNLPARVADAHSHACTARDLLAIMPALDHANVPAGLRRDWETLALLIGGIQPADALDLATEEDLLEAISRIADQVPLTALDYARLGPEAADRLWQTLELTEWLRRPDLVKLLWAPAAGVVRFDCLDAAAVTGGILRQFGHTVLASATLGPAEHFAAGLGLEPAEIGRLEALTPWRDQSFDVAVDLRVDTRYARRGQHYATTAATVVRLSHAAAQCVVVFFPSYAYAERIARQVEDDGHPTRVAVQPRLPDLAAQTAWVEQAFALNDALFLVLGSSFAEGIDLLGGRATHAMVVGPALPEVNARQRSRLTALERDGLSREDAFDRVYRVPGLQKVNQGLGRLVRAPGQRARILLHCNRFIEPAFARLLASDYQFGQHVTTTAELDAWLDSPADPPR